MRKIEWRSLKNSVYGLNEPSEEKSVREWISLSEANQQYYDKLKSFLLAGEKEDVDVRKNFSRFIRKTGIAKRRILYASVSVAACLVAAIMLFPSPQLDLTEASHAIQHGISRAVIIAGDRGPIELGDVSSTPNLTDVGVVFSEEGKGVMYDPAVTGSTDEIHILRVPRGGEFTLTMSDGTVVYLNSETDITYPPVFSGDHRRVTLRGEAYFDVRPSEKPFIVEVGDMAVTVLGTEFNVRYYDDEEVCHTTLVSGCVHVFNDATDTELELHPGEQAFLEKGNTMVKKTVDVSRYTAWKNGMFAFEDEKLADIMVKLSRWYNMEFNFEDVSLGELRLTGTMDRYGDVKELLGKFEKLGVLRFDISGNSINVRSNRLP